MSGDVDLRQAIAEATGESVFTRPENIFAKELEALMNPKGNSYDLRGGK
jgi:hypothetical protein